MSCFFVGEGLEHDTLLTLKSPHSRNIVTSLTLECRQAKVDSDWLVKNRKGWS